MITNDQQTEIGLPRAELASQPPVRVSRIRNFVGRAVGLRVSAINYVLSLGLVVLIWELVTRLQMVSPAVLRPPADVAWAINRYRDPLRDAAYVTLKEIMMGYGIAVAIGVFLGVFLTYFRVFRALVSPALVVFQSMPKVAFAPILLIWFGFGTQPVVIMVVLLAVFPIIIQTAVGFELVEPELHELARSLRANRLRRFARIDFPSALPSCFAGLKVAMTMAVIGAIVGELVSTSAGLGFIIQSASVSGDVALSLGALVVLSLMGLALYQGVSFIERIAAPWHLERQEAR